MKQVIACLVVSAALLLPAAAQAHPMSIATANSHANYVASIACALQAQADGAPCVTYATNGCGWNVPGWEGVMATCHIWWRNNYGGNYRTCRKNINVIHGSDEGYYYNDANPTNYSCSWLG